jgi:hypothetical protein
MRLQIAGSEGPSLRCRISSLSNPLIAKKEAALCWKSNMKNRIALSGR